MNYLLQENRLIKTFSYAVIVLMLGFLLSPKTIVLDVLFAVFILLPFPWIAKILYVKTDVFKHPLFLFIALFAAYYALSAAWTPTEFVVTQWYKPLVYGILILVFCAALSFLKLNSPALFDQMLTWLIYAAAFAAVLSILNWYHLSDGAFSSRLRGITRAHQSIQGAACYGLVFLLALIKMHGPVPSLQKIAFAVCAFLCLTFVVLAQTRGILIAMAGATLVMYVLKREIKPLLYLSILVAVVIIIGLIWFDWSVLLDRLLRSMPYRVEGWLSVFFKSLDAPWFGHGALYNQVIKISNYVLPHAHNVYLGIFFLTGLVGLLLYSIMVMCALYYGFINRAEGTYLFAL
ncbi:MAG: O-antigen ligase family protein, partial [Gammaproteobacteria bacterium]